MTRGVFVGSFRKTVRGVGRNLVDTVGVAVRSLCDRPPCCPFDWLDSHRCCLVLPDVLAVVLAVVGLWFLGALGHLLSVRTVGAIFLVRAASAVGRISSFTGCVVARSARLTALRWSNYGRAVKVA